MTPLRIIVTRQQIEIFELALAALDKIDNPDEWESIQKAAIESQLVTLRAELKDLEGE